MTTPSDPTRPDSEAASPGVSTHQVVHNLVMQRLFGVRAEPIRFGRYEVRSRLGRGAMGSVFLAHDPELDRLVAVKVLHAELAADDRDLLVAEAQTMARVQNPNVVAVYDVGEEDGRVYVAMERVVGMSLRAWVGGERSWREIVRVYRDAARGLAAAHDANVVHRDFKPDNALIGEDGRVAVLDFGLALRTSSPAGTLIRPRTETTEEPTETTQQLAGTPAYLAPEVLDGGAATTASDQFSFGVSLHEALYTERPFHGETMMQLLFNISSNARVAKPRDRGIPGRVDAVLERCLQPDPGDRFGSMADVAAALDQTLDRRLVAPMALATLVVGGSAYWLGAQATPTDGPHCTDGAEQLDGIWDATRGSELQAAMLATQLPYAEATWQRAAATLDDYAEQWRAQRQDACESFRVRAEHSEVVFDARMLCLERRRRDLGALVDVLGESGRRGVDRAADALGRLRPVGDCADLERLDDTIPMPRDEAVAAEVAALQNDLSRTTALQNIGRSDQAFDAATDAVERARQVDYPPVLVGALHAHGLANIGLGNAAEAERDLQDAYFVALQAGLDDSAAALGLSLSHHVGDSQQRFDEGLRWYRSGLALLKRARLTGGRTEAWLHNNAGNVLMRAGRYDEANDELQLAVELGEALDPPDPISEASFLTNLGNLSLRMGKVKRAEALLTQALTLRESALGPDHPRLVVTLQGLAAVAGSTSDPTSAAAHLERALKVLDATGGGDPLQRASTLSNLAAMRGDLGEVEPALAAFDQAIGLLDGSQYAGTNTHGTIIYMKAQLLVDAGRAAEAITVTKRAFALLAKVLEPTHPLIVEVRSGLADMQMRADRPVEALQTYEALLADLQALGDDDAMILADPLAGQALTLLSMDRPGEALAPAHRAVELYRGATDVEPISFARALLGLSDALHATSKPDAAQEVAREALPLVADAEGGVGRKLHEQLQAILAR